MSPLEYTKKRLQIFLDEIERLLDLEFPYYHSKEALELIEEVFKSKQSHLDKLTPSSDQDIINQICTLTLRNLFVYLPILGFILRSTNVRNAFEVFGPTLRLAGDLLEPTVKPEYRKTKLILSSEWDYSPYCYRELPDLPGFVLIGLPAPETNSPFLVPLFGHEMGHLVWAKNQMKNHFSPIISNNIVDIIQSRWKDWKKVFPRPEIEPHEVATNMFALQYWTRALIWALNQSQETFSDFIGLSIFGSSFLRAFAYLLSPKLSEVRSINYPNMCKRVQNLIDASKFYKIQFPDNYLSLFEDSIEPTMTEADKFLLSIADQALDEVADKLMTQAKIIVDASNLDKPSKEEETRIYNSYQEIVPAEKCQALPDILNAAWQAFENPKLWEDIPQVKDQKYNILKEIVLKNIEVFEIEQILKEEV